MRVILASASPRRKELLSRLGIAFEVVPSNIREDNSISGLIPEELTMELAFRKAMDVVRGIKGNALVIGADTIVVKDGNVFGKPADKEDAYRMLKCLQGQTHEVITGLAVIDTGKGDFEKAFEKTLVEVAPLSDDEIKRYVETGEPMDKAGAYGIQGVASIFIKRIVGCYYNVMGLPLYRLWRMLEKFGVRVF